MITSLLLLLLPVAAASGWFSAKRAAEANSLERNREQFTQDYFIGLSYLLNEQPDKAVDTFIKMLAVDSETVETHLALGALFRRRGEVDRAIRIHQNLIARPHLPKHQRAEALLALGQDYLKAGVLDRAERLFLDIIEANYDNQASAFKFLLDIYQQQKQWQCAVGIAQQLKNSDAVMKNNIAHYYCEMAQQAQQKKHYEKARDYLQLAIDTNSVCARAYLLLGALEMEQENWLAALAAYQEVKNQDLTYFGETIAPLIHCFKQLGRESEVIHYFENCIKQHPQVSLILAMTELMRNQLGTPQAYEFLAKQLPKTPSVRGLAKLIELQLDLAPEPVKDQLLLLQSAVQRLLKNKSNYHCEQCGFTSRVMHWLCPGCKTWESVKETQNLLENFHR